MSKKIPKELLPEVVKGVNPEKKYGEFVKKTEGTEGGGDPRANIKQRARISDAEVQAQIEATEKKFRVGRR